MKGHCVPRVEDKRSQCVLPTSPPKTPGFLFQYQTYTCININPTIHPHFQGYDLRLLAALENGFFYASRLKMKIIKARWRGERRLTNRISSDSGFKQYVSFGSAALLFKHISDLGENIASIYRRYRVHFLFYFSIFVASNIW